MKRSQLFLNPFWLPILFWIIVLAWLPDQVLAQEFENPRSPNPISKHKPYAEVQYHSGIYWSRTEYLSEAFEEGYRSLEARLGFRTTGSKSWHHVHGFPKYGLGIHYADLIKDPEDTIMGNPISGFLYYSAPWARFWRFTLNTDLSLGLSYASVIHDPVHNPYNDVIASHINLYFDFTLNLDLRLTNRLDLSAGYGVTHYSNGRIHQPQKGVNCWGWNVGMRYDLESTLPGYIKSEVETFQSSEEIQVMYGAGTVEHHRLGEAEGIRYFTSSFAVDYAVTFNRRMAVTFGTDVLFDGSIGRAIKGVPEEEVTTIQKTYLGSHIGYHFLIDRVTILFNLGTYFNQHTYDRGAWFIRAGGRVRLTDHFHTQICIKTKNGVRADWIEWGLIYAIKVRKERKKGEKP